MSELVHLPAFIAAAALTIAMPGPATLLVATRAVASRRAALVAVAGIVAGDSIAITLGGAGLAGAMARMPELLQGLRLAGAAYVAWMGVKLLRQAQAQVAGSAPGEPEARGAGPRAFMQALAMTLANPKAMLFFAAFFPLFIAPRATAPLLAFWRLGAFFEVINLAWFAAIVAVAGAVRSWQTARGAATLRRAGGLGLIACAALVLVA